MSIVIAPLLLLVGADAFAPPLPLRHSPCQPLFASGDSKFGDVLELAGKAMLEASRSSGSQGKGGIVDLAYDLLKTADGKSSNAADSNKPASSGSKESILSTAYDLYHAYKGSSSSSPSSSSSSSSRSSSLDTPGTSSSNSSSDNSETSLLSTAFDLYNAYKVSSSNTSPATVTASNPESTSASGSVDKGSLLSLAFDLYHSYKGSDDKSSSSDLANDSSEKISPSSKTNDKGVLALVTGLAYWLDARAKDKAMEFTHKSEYKFGDISREIVRRVETGEYTKDDLMMLLKLVAAVGVNFTPIAKLFSAKALIDMFNVSMSTKVGAKVRDVVMEELSKRMGKSGALKGIADKYIDENTAKKILDRVLRHQGTTNAPAATPKRELNYQQSMRDIDDWDKEFRAHR